MDFVDLKGASGETYRFRRWPDTGVHPPIAGNFIVLQTRTQSIVRVGLSDNLAEMPAEVGDLEPGAALFTRLNVPRVRREAEHEDLAAAQVLRSGSAAA